MKNDKNFEKFFKHEDNSIRIEQHWCRIFQGKNASTPITAWSPTFCQISSNVSTPSLTFLRQRSISPIGERIESYSPSKWSRHMQHWGHHDVHRSRFTDLEAFFYLPLPRCLVYYHHSFDTTQLHNNLTYLRFLEIVQKMMIWPQNLAKLSSKFSVLWSFSPLKGILWTRWNTLRMCYRRLVFRPPAWTLGNILKITGKFFWESKTKSYLWKISPGFLIR